MIATPRTLAIAGYTFAALALVPICNGALAQDLVQAGVSAAVQGQVNVARVDAVGRQIDSGEPIFLNDAITSGPDSGMQIMLLDETVFTIGPESEISIDTFVYDPGTGQGSLAANMTKGVMRFVTGNVSSGNPESMTIKLPVGTIGIRGTIGDVVILTQEQANQVFPEQTPSGNVPNQPVVFAALSGPGPLTQTGANVGSFTFSSPDGSVDLNRPGGSVLATPGQPPVFFIASPEQLGQVTTGTTPKGNTQNASQNDSNNSSGGSSSASGGGTQNVQSQSNASNDTSFKQVNTINTTTGTTSQTQNAANTNSLATVTNGFTYADIAAAFSGESA
ncbi:MAG: FecR domain-containing protein, partial [Alphaproteobacteria bacterium]|nr:FecR domain-containing protein [Alphaproteobacteria bacterium]